jgi:hypothetical protein
MAITWKKVAFEADVITKALLTTVGDIIYASGVSTPARLGVGADTNVLTLAAGVPTWAAPAAAAAHTLNSHTAANGAVDFNLQQATDLVIMTVANEAALPAGAGTVAVGQPCFATGELSLHICTASA